MRPLLIAVAALVAATLLALGFAGGWVAARLIEYDPVPGGARCAPSVIDEPDPVPGTEAALIEQLAPLVILHPRERFMPMPAGCFIDNATDRGAYLDLDNDWRSGIRDAADGPFLSGVPVYYDRVPGWIVYWTFYGYSAPGALAQPGGARAGSHEGDWENIAIRVSPTGAPLEAVYYEHGKAHRVPWERVKKFGTHPIVYSAQGSHASYASVGRQRNADVTSTGYLWPTWEELRNVRTRPWYGSTDRWGTATFPTKGGPLGPGPAKLGYPTED